MSDGCGGARLPRLSNLTSLLCSCFLKKKSPLLLYKRKELFIPFLSCSPLFFSLFRENHTCFNYSTFWWLNNDFSGDSTSLLINLLNGQERIKRPRYYPLCQYFEPRADEFIKRELVTLLRWERDIYALLKLDQIHTRPVKDSAVLDTGTASLV
jgi:hypothetical protein